MDELGERIRARRPRPDAILAVARGGLAPATLLAHRFEIPEVESIRARVTENDGPHTPKRSSVDLGALPPAYEADRLLVVDDVIGTGRTWHAVNDAVRARRSRALSPPMWVVLYPNLDNAEVAVPDDVLIGWTSREWVVFPWERRRRRSD